MTWAQHKSRAGIERKIIALQRRRGAVAEPLQPAVGKEGRSHPDRALARMGAAVAEVGRVAMNNPQDFQARKDRGVRAVRSGAT